jgi:hypothetical protein
VDHSRPSGAFQLVDVSLPPHSAGAIEARQGLALPPWPGDSLALRFFVDPSSPPAGYETIAEPRVLNLAGPELRVARGVKIAFVSPRPRNVGTAVAPSHTSAARVGQRVAIRGTTSPPIPGQRLALVDRAGRSGHSTRIAKVTVRRDGKFAYANWAPSVRGTHTINATYRSQRTTRATTHTQCGPVVVVK